LQCEDDADALQGKTNKVSLCPKAINYLEGVLQASRMVKRCWKRALFLVNNIKDLFVRPCAKPRSYRPPPPSTMHIRMLWTYCMAEVLMGNDIVVRRSSNNHQSLPGSHTSPGQQPPRKVTGLGEARAHKLQRLPPLVLTTPLCLTHTHPVKILSKHHKLPALSFRLFAAPVEDSSTCLSWKSANKEATLRRALFQDIVALPLSIRIDHHIA
jgi:hypothetical protein